MVVRSLPEGNKLWSATFPLSKAFKPAVVTCDVQLIVICGQEDGSSSKKSGYVGILMLKYALFFLHS
jgi:hypothetical protein